MAKTNETLEEVATTEVNPRLIKMGDIVEANGIEGPNVVIAVSVVLHLSNGMDVRYRTDTEKVKKYPPEDLTGLIAEIESAPVE